MRAHHWQIDLAYRRLTANKWYVGTEPRESAAPFGKPLFININSLDVSVNYGVTDRFALTLTLPFSGGTHSRFYGDGKRHQVAAAGLGDISTVATVWLLNPHKHEDANLALGVGVKTPSGSNSVTDDFFLADGSVIQSAVDQSIQLGDGGWGLIMQMQGYRKLFRRTSGYVNGAYLLSPQDQTDVKSPYPGVTLSIPDVYSARAGIAYALEPKRGLSASLGIRVDGIPIRDLVGDSDGFRRPGYSLYIDPGVTFSHGRNTFTLNVPVRVHQNFERSLVDVQLGKTGGGDLAKYLIFVGYSVRF